MFNYKFVLDFLKHRLKAKTRHGVHSPFIYKLVDEVIYDFIPKSDYKNIEDLRNNLSVDDRWINITDLGAGSHANNNKQKQVSQITNSALKPKKLAQLIYRLAKYQQPKNIIELGTCLGITSSYLATAVPEARIVTMEGCPETAGIAKENFEKLNITNIDLVVGNFDNQLPAVIATEDRLDFVFVDGNHRKEATVNYFKWCLPKIHENSLLIFDDIYWSEGMKEAWEEIKSHPDVTVTVDLFWIGLVFFKKGIAKEHFKIKF